MAAKVKILIEGYTNADSVAETGEERTQPTVTLIIDKNLIMVVDPGIMDSQQILVDALAQEDLNVEDVNIVCVTHSHIDHYRNIGMFPNAKVLEYFGLWSKNTVEDWKEQFSDHIQILKTPGHDYTGITIFATTESDSQCPGVVAVCGDVFWKENYPENDIYATDIKKLKESREMVLKMADWIIPGHAGIYKVKKGSFVPIKPPSFLEKIKNLTDGLVCKKCKRIMAPKDKCLCRPWLCYRCCECGIDCNLCSCSHEKYRK